HEWEIHQAPHDYFRYTRFGLAWLLETAGFEVREMRPAGGYFRLLARRLLNGLQFFSGGFRWLLFIPAAILLVPPAMLLPFPICMSGKYTRPRTIIFATRASALPGCWKRPASKCARCVRRAAISASWPAGC